MYFHSMKLTHLGGIFSGNGAFFPNTDFSDLTDYQKNQMNLYSFPLVFSDKDFSDLSDYQMNQMNLYSFPQLDSTLSSVIYLTLGLRCRSFHFTARFLAMAELK